MPNRPGKTLARFTSDNDRGEPRKSQGKSKETAKFFQRNLKAPEKKSMEPKTGCIFEFGEFRLDGYGRRLWRGGERVQLPPKVFDLLVVLVENSGHIVTKEDLMNRIWADTFVEDANLTVNVAALRKALGKSPDGASYIETVPKYGYRFIADVIESPKVTTTGTGIGSDTADRSQQGGYEIAVSAEPNESSGEVSDADTNIRETPASTRTYGRLTFSPGRVGRLATISVFLLAATAAGLFAWWKLAGAAQSSAETTAPPIASIAVLPFENGVQDPDAEYLSDGITESLINRLSQLSGLKVASRGSSFRYKGKDKDTNRIGTELNVSSVLTGSVRQVGDDLIILVSLDSVRNDQHIWGVQYVRKSKDVLSLQEEIARDVTRNLRLRLTGADQKKLDKKYTRNTEAYILYLKGNYEWNKHRLMDVRKAI
jgi:TolB-like protein/DNA-binding winged helix-turn-helix (wHTH) protein